MTYSTVELTGATAVHHEDGARYSLEYDNPDATMVVVEKRMFEQLFDFAWLWERDTGQRTADQVVHAFALDEGTQLADMVTAAFMRLHGAEVEVVEFIVRTDDLVVTCRNKKYDTPDEIEDDGEPSDPWAGDASLDRDQDRAEQVQ